MKVPLSLKTSWHGEEGKRTWLLLGLLALVCLVGFWPRRENVAVFPPAAREAREGAASAEAHPGGGGGRFTPLPAARAREVILARNLFKPLLTDNVPLTSDEGQAAEAAVALPWSSSPPPLAPLPHERKTAPPVAPASPPAEMAAWRLLGIVQWGEERQALLTRQGGGDRYVREGESLAPGVKVEAIEAESVIVSEGGRRRRLTLPRSFNLVPLEKASGQ